MANTQFILRVSCPTFNHSKYIEDCMNGFCLQQTDFPFICTIIDDASTDGARNVINNYLEEHFEMDGLAILPDIYSSSNGTSDYAAMEQRNKQLAEHAAPWRCDAVEGIYTFVQHKTNKNCFFLSINLNRNLYGVKDSKSMLIAPWNEVKYIALCEGDDYWTAPMKLQKQVDFLESHPDFSLCCHKISLYFENDGTVVAKNYDAYENHEADFTFSNHENLRHWITETSSVVFRNGLLDSNIRNIYYYYRDVHQAYHLLKKGKGRFLNFQGSVYRKHCGGIYTSLSSLERYHITYNVYHELRDNNADDPTIVEFFYDYKKTYFSILRLFITKKEPIHNFWPVLSQFIRDTLRDDGILPAARYSYKCIKTFVKR